MTCEELRHEYGAYALGIAEDPERFEISEHLARNCPNCVPGVRKAMEMVAGLSAAAPAANPPKRLRGRVVALVSPPAERRFPITVLVPWAVASALAVALIAVAVPGVLHSGDAARLAQALSIIGDPAMQDVSFGPPATRGRVFLSPGKGVVLVAAGLPPLDVNKTFELWVIPKTGNPIPAGTFRSQANAAVFVHPGVALNAAALAVTIEPEGGSLQPTTTPFIVAKL